MKWIINPILFLLVIFFLVTGTALAAPPLQQDLDPDPPDQPVKLIFIHHSTGENWLTDGYGDLGRTLAENNYFVSDTNYGWGPDSIGDRTDIPNWTEWFASDQTPTYMDALFNESGQNSGYTRLFDDPGGENTIIMFKSCFPNSALEGSPYDSPDPDGWLSVGHAKYVYNEILQFFATRPDKLFIVITAPPLSDPTYAENARAFNQWLVNDWLDENDYALPNVAVFDFYNILTDRDAHHRYDNGIIEHTYGSSNTLAYPSGDDHPSEAGSQKATEEFIPLLNIFYNRWAATAPAAAQGEGNPPEDTEPGESVPSGTVGLVADFDSLTPSLASYWDEATSTRLTCAPASDAAFSGASALRMDFDVAAGSWSTCVASYDNPQDWSTGQGLAFALHASQAGIPYEIILYAGTPDNQETYIDYAETPSDSVDGWATVELSWTEFVRAEWEAEAGTPFNKPAEVLAFAFGFSAGDSNNVGTVWVDDVSLLGQEAAPEDQPEPDGGSGLPCLGTIILPLVLAGLAWFIRRR